VSIAKWSNGASAPESSLGSRFHTHKYTHMRYVFFTIACMRMQNVRDTTCITLTCLHTHTHTHPHTHTNPPHAHTDERTPLKSSESQAQVVVEEGWGLGIILALGALTFANLAGQVYWWKAHTFVHAFINPRPQPHALSHACSIDIFLRTFG